MKLENLKGKKIAIAGLGVNNRKMADYFSSHGIKFEVVENWHTQEELTESLRGFEIIFRTPGLPYLSEAIQAAKSAGAEISSQTKLFFDLCPAQIIGVTGTKGKGTTSGLIYSIMEKAGRKVFLAGNYGRDPFEFLDDLGPKDFVVMELSSFQLQDLDRSPHLAVVLSITKDHLDHHRNVEEYISAKSTIIRNQTENDVAILHPSLPDAFKKLGGGRKIIIDPNLVKYWPRKLLGRHNLDNIAAAVLAAKTFGIQELIMKSAVMEFEPLPHRLNVIKTVNGIVYVDDSFSTNSDPVMAAIDAFKSPIVLILGGHDKGIDFTPVIEKIKSSHHVKGVVVIGQMTDKILPALEGFRGKILAGAQNMQEIVKQSSSLANPGDTVILSPGTSSFDMFKNATDRAEQFIMEVNKLK